MVLVLVAAVVADRIIIMYASVVVDMVGLSDWPPEHKIVLQVISLSWLQIKAMLLQ